MKKEKVIWRYEDLVNSYLSKTFSEKTRYTDGRPIHGIGSADTVKRS